MGFIESKAQLPDKNLRNKYMSVIKTDNDNIKAFKSNNIIFKYADYDNVTFIIEAS